MLFSDSCDLADTPGVAKHAFDVDQIEQAMRLEQHLLRLVDLPESKARNTVVVAGGGVTGIETATEIPARLRAVLGDNAEVEVIIVDLGSKVGALLGPEIAQSLSRRALTTVPTSTNWGVRPFLMNLARGVWNPCSVCVGQN